MIAIRPWLFLGKYHETFELPPLQAHQISAMLQFAGKVEYPEIQTLYIPIEDGVPIPLEILKKGIGFILSQQQAGKKVMVSCGAAISRSVTFIIAALKEVENIPLLEAYQSVLNAHVGALPHPALWQSLCTYYNEDVPYWQLLKRYNRRTG
ncbi:hypothetical protein AAE02nite_48790 [Adhaeribacter aerolatus]|uniref:Tyrosine-protein phosphatase domain-containing protein n=1 Tax=Adhaeribacter aerolatus TaxID=670289 RepID=A0A512B5G6_9BACT|nr:dual specificity protein phosphatase [Adhaeribacter aerolatus]GEO07215.1 hypothetical protein AAE02nite_48790 [Adhaeribacter aerolatus]